jgi:hypothetical protein
VRLLLPTLGVNVFNIEGSAVTAVGSASPVLELRWEDAHALCVVRDGEFIVQAGSTVRVKEVDSLGDGPRALRRTLRDNGVLLPQVGSAHLLRFTQEYAFDSPSAAAAVVSGTGLNGRTAWKLKGHQVSYKEWQEQQLKSGSSTET